MKIIVCGDRKYTNRKSIYDFLSKYPKSTIIIHGGAEGADRLAGEVGAELGFEVREVKADWERYGRAAGPIRNRQMLTHNPDLVVAFHDDIKRSKGTKDMVVQARRAANKFGSRLNVIVIGSTL